MSAAMNCVMYVLYALHYILRLTECICGFFHTSHVIISITSSQSIIAKQNTVMEMQFVVCERGGES
jgi:hypothetical protein